jgi:hypothetical protein
MRYSMPFYDFIKFISNTVYIVADKFIFALISFSYKNFTTPYRCVDTLPALWGNPVEFFRAPALVPHRSSQLSWYAPRQLPQSP